MSYLSIGGDKEPMETITINLDPDQELRFEVENKNETVVIELKKGFAEIYGSELVRGKPYTFHCGAKIAIFTYHGCSIQLTGRKNVSYVAKETPMIFYLNCHACLEQLRIKVTDGWVKRGPITMIVGPADVGKTTVCRILINYAVRMGRAPIYVDLDVGQGQISVPGSIGSVLVERPASVDEGFSVDAPLVYHFGHNSINKNTQLFNLLVSKMAETVMERMLENKKANASGVIINTCGWVKGDGYRHITNAAQAFEVDIVLVLDQEKLYNELVRDLPDFVKVVLLPKSGGVVERSKQYRAEARDARVKFYFYGGKIALHPFSFDVKWSDLNIYKIGAPALPDSCMPLGMKPEDNMTKLVAVQPGPNLLHHLLAVSFASAKDEDITYSNIAGYICVTHVNVDTQTLTVLSPQPRPLPDTVLLLSDVQYMDSH